MLDRGTRPFVPYYYALLQFPGKRRTSDVRLLVDYEVNIDFRLGCAPFSGAYVRDRDAGSVII